jgi:hypothetical protein
MLTRAEHLPSKKVRKRMLPMPRKTPRASSRVARAPLAALALGLVCSLSPQSGAQSAGTSDQPAVTSRPAPSSAPAATSQPSPDGLQQLTLEEVQLRLRLTQTSPVLDESQKAEAGSLYSQAIQQLQLADRMALIASRHEAERARTPEQLRAAQAELDHPSTSNVPEVPANAALPQLDGALTRVQTELEHARLAQRELTTTHGCRRSWSTRVSRSVS